VTLLGRSLLKEVDLTRREFCYLLELSRQLRTSKRAAERPLRLAGLNIALVFEKTSTRTRSAFEVAAHDEGASVTYLGPEDTHLGYRESMKDTARVLGRMFDGIEYRGSSQDAVETLGEFAGVPVWNGMTDQWHPTQALADVLTMSDHSRKPLEEISCCFIGNRGQIANSLLVSGALLGMDVRVCTPASRMPFPAVQDAARRLAAKSGSRVTVTADLAEAVPGADFVYTDSWLPIDRPAEWDERINLFVPGYQVNSRLIESTGNPDVKFMHNLPALHSKDTQIGRQVFERYGLEGLEVTDDVFNSSASIVFDQAENRLHTIKAVMVASLAAPEHGCAQAEAITGEAITGEAGRGEADLSPA
jgi:ornithine carbamoyltransferase